MEIPNKIRRYLFQHHVAYAHYVHPPAFTSRAIAHDDDFPEGQFAKTVVLRADGQTILAVLPSDQLVDLELLKKQIGCKELSLAREIEFGSHFRECQTGAMPPFGKLFRLPVYCDTALAKQPVIEFNAGTHADTIRMKYDGFVKLENPVMIDFSGGAGSLRN